MNRRNALKAAGALIAAPMLLSKPTYGQNVVDIDYVDFSGPLPNLALFGSNPALPKEEQIAKDILAKAPHATILVDVALYFESLPRLNDSGEFYNAAWATRWNPVVVGFYRHTDLSPHYVLNNGDTIPWCAAFLNWCLEACGYQTTDSASSGSFRSYGDSTDSPAIGDIAVFKSSNADDANVGRGHVGIFVAKTTDGLWILGGNQKAGKRYSSVCMSFFPSDMKALTFHSFRRPVRAHAAH